MAALSPQDLKSRATATEKFAPVTVTVPVLGGDVCVRRLTAGQLDEYADAIDKAPADKARATILLHAVCDEQGRQVFNSDDVPELAKFAAPVATGIIAAFREANGLAGKG